MFQPKVIIAPEASFEATVSYPQPLGDNRYHTHKFKLRFAVRPASEGDKLRRDILSATEEIEDPEELRAYVVKQIGRIVIGWPDGEIGDEKGKPVPYSEEALAALLEVPGLAMRIMETYRLALDGPAKTGRRRGN